MAKSQINGINVHHQAKGEGPDVVLIHGITSTMAVWYTQVMPELCREFRVTMYDLRGHGYTELTQSGYTSLQLADDLLHLMDHLGIERARLVGHSFGGVVGLHLAALHPDRVEGVVVSDAGIACLRHLRNIEDWPGWETWKDELAERDISYDQFTDDPEIMIRQSFKIPRQFGMRKGEPRGTKRLQRLLDESNVIREFREVAGLTEEVLASIQAPVQALYGSESPYRGVVSRLGELLPNCCRALLTGTGHFLLLQEPNVFISHVLEFIRDPAEYIETHRSQSFAQHGAAKNKQETST